jgi:hypothetical protein
LEASPWRCGPSRAGTDGGVTVDSGARALPEEIIDRVAQRLAPGPPPWLEPLAELVAAKLEPVVRAEIRAALDVDRGRAE